MNDHEESTIQRADDDDELYFTSVNNGCLRNPNLSLAAKGLISYLLTHDKNFPVSIKFIRESQKIPRRQLTNAMREAEEAGYVKRIIYKGEKNLLRTKFIISSLPRFKINSPMTRFRCTESGIADDGIAKPKSLKPLRERETREALVPSIEVPEQLKSHGSYVKLKDSQVKSLIEEWGEPLVNHLIVEVNSYCETSRTQGYANYETALKTYWRRMSETKKAQISNANVPRIDQKRKAKVSPSDVKENEREAVAFESEVIAMTPKKRGQRGVTAEKNEVNFHRGSKIESLSYEMPHKEFKMNLDNWRKSFN